MAYFEPRSGGRFDVTHMGGTLQVHMDIAIKSNIAENTDGTPVDIDIDANDYVNWPQDFGRVITQNWENKFQFTRGTSIVRPSFSQTFMSITDGNASQCHYAINMTRGDASSNVSNNVHPFFEDLEKQGLYAPRKVQLGVTSNKPIDTKFMTQAALPNLFPFYVDTYGGSMSRSTESQLLDLSKQIAGFAPNLKVYLTPHGQSSTTSLAEVRRVMLLGGMTNLNNRKSKRIFSTSKSKQSGRRNYVKISLSAPMPSPVLGHSNLYTYPATVVHEFGHMLGLKDEYICLSDEARNAMVTLDFIEPDEALALPNREMKNAGTALPDVQHQQAEFIQYCKDADVTPPVFGQHNASIMSAGSIFYPCHFVTMWAALCQLSGHNDWRIVPHT